MKKTLHPLDIRNKTKEEAVQNLFRAEQMYLVSRGWEMLCGTIDDKYYVAPNEDFENSKTIFHNHDEALRIQKQIDKSNV